MLVSAGLSASWYQSRAHRFFATARWSAGQLGLRLLELIACLLVPVDAPVRLVADDTLFRRSGREIYGAGWHHDPLGAGRHPIAWGYNWVVVGVLVDLPMLPSRTTSWSSTSITRSGGVAMAPSWQRLGGSLKRRGRPLPRDLAC